MYGVGQTPSPTTQQAFAGQQPPSYTGPVIPTGSPASDPALQQGGYPTLGGGGWDPHAGQSGYYAGGGVDSTGMPQTSYWVPTNGGYQPRDTGIGGRLNTGIGGGSPPQVNPQDPSSVDAYISYMGQQPGVNPSVRNDPNYWRQKILSGELGTDPGYYQSKMMTPEGPPAGGGGGMGGGMSLGSLGGAFLQPYTGQAPQFQPPTGLDYMNDPGYQARLKMGTDALQNSAFARGKGLTGGALKDLTQYAQDYASNEYGNVFNRAQQTYGANLNQFDRNYDIFRNNQTDSFNKLMGVTNLGYGAAGQSNAALGAYGTNISNLGKDVGTTNTTLAGDAINAQTGIGNAQGQGSILGGLNNGQLGSAIGTGVQNALDSWYRRNSPGY